MRRYAASDYEEIAGWYRARGEEPPAAECLPALGYLEPGVAGLFAYRTDAPVAILDAGITNPAASLRARSRALEQALRSLLADLERQGVRHVIGSTRSRGFMRIGVRSGFTSAGQYTTMARAV